MEGKVKVFMVAEKASIARSIAEAVAGRGKYVPRQGKTKICPIMQWDGEFQGKKAEFHCTSVAGHIFNRDIPEELQDWRKIDPIQLFDAPTLKKVANPEQNIVEHLQEESKNSDYVVLWLDCDREGENICFEVLEVIDKNIKKGSGQQVYRAKFSSITQGDLLEAFKTLKNGPNKNESLAVDARQVIDLKVGYAFTRLQSKHLSRKYEDLAQNTVSYGPCQTPTLAFCVERSQQISSFQPEQLDVIKVQVELPDKSVQEVVSREKQGKVKIQKDNCKTAEVVKYEEKTETAAPPVGLNTIQMLQISSQYLRLSPQETMKMAEHLYLQGFLTYPRTETTKYASTFDLLGPLKTIEQSKLKNLATQLMSQKPVQPSGGVDAGDHPPITPTVKLPTQFENPQEEQLYELIVRYYMATLAGPAKYHVANIEYKTGGQTFQYEGVKTLVPAFEDYLPQLKRQEKPFIPLKKGSQLPIKSVQYTEEKTQPPPYLSEVELIQLMDKNRIGTDASLATHINTICERKYVVVDPQTRQLKTLKLGEAFIFGLKEIDPDLCGPKLRSNMEKMLDQIATGKADYEKVLSQVLAQFKEKYLKYQKNIQAIEKHFDGVFQSVDDAMKNAPAFSVCGRCKNQMRLLQGKVFCEKCKCMYGLPKKVEYKRSNQNCEKDGFEFIFCEYPGSKGQPQKVCPQCSQQAWKAQQQTQGK